jgi:hypothetical protein
MDSLYLIGIAVLGLFAFVLAIVLFNFLLHRNRGVELGNAWPL